jgi:hypothetical protein
VISNQIAVKSAEVICEGKYCSGPIKVSVVRIFMSDPCALFSSLSLCFCFCLQLWF